MLAAVIFLLLEAHVEMDVPTRPSYVLAVVRSDERTLVAGITGLVCLGALPRSAPGLIAERGAGEVVERSAMRRRGLRSH